MQRSPVNGGTRLAVEKLIESNKFASCKIPPCMAIAVSSVGQYIYGHHVIYDILLKASHSTVFRVNF